MNTRLVLLALATALAAPLVYAHGQQKHEAAPITPGRDATNAELSVAPAAADAVAVIDRFSEALGSGALDKAAVEVDPAVLILESGGVERSRDEYLAGHAKSDAEFLKPAHVTLKRRTAQAAGGVGDRQFLRSMIPHHASAILMCQEASIESPEIARLCAGIVDSQNGEIAQMKRMLESTR